MSQAQLDQRNNEMVSVDDDAVKKRGAKRRHESNDMFSEMSSPPPTPAKQKTPRTRKPTSSAGTTQTDPLFVPPFPVKENGVPTSNNTTTLDRARAVAAEVRYVNPRQSSDMRENHSGYSMSLESKSEPPYFYNEILQLSDSQRLFDSAEWSESDQPYFYEKIIKNSMFLHSEWRGIDYSVGE